MKREDAEEYTQALGQVVAGGWRQIALGERMGVPKALGLTVKAWVESRLGGYVKLSVDERRQAAAELKKEGKTQREIGAVLGVDHRTVGNDLEAGEFSPNNDVDASESGEFSPSTPLDVIAGLAADDAVRTEAGREERRGQRRAERVEKINEISAANTALDVDRLVPVLYADPPWQYEHVKTDNRAIENHYPTMTLDAICALHVPATEDAVLFLWATSPKLAEAMHVIEAWGFTYRTCMVWVKDKIGMGYYARQQHELLLVAARGNLPVPEPANRPPSVVMADRTEHSHKPDAFYEVIERMYPEFDKRELFQRGEVRIGWIPGWGNQAIEVAS